MIWLISYELYDLTQNHMPEIYSKRLFTSYTVKNIFMLDFLYYLPLDRKLDCQYVPFMRDYFIDKNFMIKV